MPALTVPAAMPVVRRAIVVPLERVELRDAQGAGGSLVFEGYAAVTNTTTTLYEGRAWVWQERILPGAFRGVLERIAGGNATYPVVLNHEHDNAAAMASTDVDPRAVGHLGLSEDTTGLRVFARLNPEDTDVQRVARKVRDGIVRQMSFAFRIAPGGWTTTTTEDDQGRVVETDDITEVGDLFDVTLCAHGAYPTTTADIRGLMVACSRSGLDPEGPEARALMRGLTIQDAAPADPAGPDRTTSAAPDGPVGDGDPDRTRRLAAMRARARAAVATLNTVR